MSFDLDLPGSSEEEANNLALARLQALTAADLSGEAETAFSPSLKPGITVEIDGLEARFDGRYHVTGVTHRFNEGPDALHRTLLQVGRSDRGLFCLPEVDDEVLVAFEHGDISRPYVVGSLWSSPPSCGRCRESGSQHGQCPDDDDNDDQLELRLGRLPTRGEVTRTPWASSYWPAFEDSINVSWDGPQTESAAAKYGRAFGVTGIEEVVSKVHGVHSAVNQQACAKDADCAAGAICSGIVAEQGRCMPTRWGLWQGWAASALLVPEPRHPVTHNGVTFKVNDIKALLAITHQTSTRQPLSPGCPQDQGTGSADCKDGSASTFHVLLTNYLGRRGQSFVADRSQGDEVWSQPVRGYRVTAMKEESALRFRVQVEVDYIAPSPSTVDGHLGGPIDQFTHTDKFDYILELGPSGKIIGGEWLDDSKNQHPDFIWLPHRSVGNSTLPIDARWVRELARQSLRNPTDAGAP